MRDPQAPATILIVEDETKLANLLADYLRGAKFETLCVTDGREVAPAVKANDPDLILLDLMLPGRDGIAVCRELRTFTDTPLIIVTGRVDEIDRLLGLELGADDYICKPFSPREMVARVNAVLRRSRGRELAPPRTRLVIDRQSYRATLDGVPLALTPAEFRLLDALAQHPNKVWSRDQLLDSLYTDHRVVVDRTVDSHIKNLRHKLQRASKDSAIVRSIYGVGYKLEL
ncbi:MAG TPA: response regulator [Casimicrobiaceae bacterium]|jgi:two-component system response regulator BaeR